MLGNKEREAVLVEISSKLNVSRGKAKELLFGWAYRATEERLKAVIKE